MKDTKVGEDRLAVAGRLRGRVKEIRDVAESMLELDAKRMALRLADQYEWMARQADAQTTKLPKDREP